MKNTEPKLPSNKSFGYFMAFVFLVFAIIFLRKNYLNFATIFLIISCSFTLFALLKPHLLSSLNQLWLKLGLLLGSFVNPIVLLTLYMILFTPIGFTLRVFGKNQLDLKATKKSTYWRSKDQNAKGGTFFEQY